MHNGTDISSVSALIDLGVRCGGTNSL